MLKYENTAQVNDMTYIDYKYREFVAAHTDFDRQHVLPEHLNVHYFDGFDLASRLHKRAEYEAAVRNLRGDDALAFRMGYDAQIEQLSRY
jgi:hypothetical protein